MMEPFWASFGAFLAALGLAGPVGHYQGYVEGDYVLVAPQIAGTLDSVNVVRGQTVRQGDSLFVQEHAFETAAFEQAKAIDARAEAVLADLIKTKRLPELEALGAQRDQAQAALRLATITYERDLKQLNVKAVSQAVVDADKAAMDQAKGRLDEAEASLAVGRLSVGRDDAIRAAQADVVAAQAALAAAQWKLDQKQVAAPAHAFVFDTLYRAGEYVSAGQPVVSLLPSSNIRVRFFVPEKNLASISSGMAVRAHVDGESGTHAARVTYISPKAEYSPPQLYNRDNRERLLFMIEATPDAKPEELHPGQPVDVTVAAP
jgi:HlyD family secretion protein